MVRIWMLGDLFSDPKDFTISATKGIDKKYSKGVDQIFTQKSGAQRK